MARDLITPVKSSEMSTAFTQLTTEKCITISTANGAYIKTGGSSNIDASRLLFVICRRSSKTTKAATLYVIPGSTSGNEDFEKGKYDTARMLRLTLGVSTVTTHKKDIRFFTIPETARFKDTDGYIKFNFSTAFGNGGSASKKISMGAIYLKP